MKQGDTTALPRHPGGHITAPVQARPEPVRNWAGPAWDARTGQMVHPGQPRLRAPAAQAEDNHAEAGKSLANHANQTSTTISPVVSSAETPPCEKTPRKRRYSTPRAETAPTPLEDRRWLTVKQTAQRYPYSEGALRHLIWEAEAYAKHPKSGLKSNGFLDCIVRPEGTRRVLIDAEKFERWLQGA